MKTIKIFFLAACFAAVSNVSFGQTNVKLETTQHEISPIDPYSNPYFDEKKHAVMYPENTADIEIPWYYRAIFRFSIFML